MKMPVVLIDNGHGWNTPGKRSPDGVFREWAWAREIAVNIVEDLKEQGVTAFLLVHEDEDIALATRVARVEGYCREYGKQNVILVSIHNNAAGDGGEWMSAKGWAAYTTPGETSSDRLALYLYAEAEKAFEGRKIRIYQNKRNPDWESNLYLLRKTSCTAVLTENFFMDNRDDLSFIRSREGKKAVIACHVKGIMGYIENEYE